MKTYGKFILSDQVAEVLEKAKSVDIPKTKAELYAMVFGKAGQEIFKVEYDVPGIGLVEEATVVHCKNGVSVNYPEDYMRRRDPDCMRIADDLPTDKPIFEQVYGRSFDVLRRETYDWLKSQKLIVIPYKAGGTKYGYLSLAICPKNAAFFALALADLQGFVCYDDIEDFSPRAIVYVAPVFRHTDFNGKQVVVHSRTDTLHEVFSYNLYPGPSAKKGIYSVLIDIGEKEGWITAHASAVQVITPYENEIVFMHEGASGSGKSEMLEELRREKDRSFLLAVNTLNGETTAIHLSSEVSSLCPIADDMVLCHPSFQNDSGKLVIADAEEGWFVRVDNIAHYGANYEYESISIHPDEPLAFFNIQGAPNATCLIWDHILDSNCEPCTNPRVIIPRRLIRNIVARPLEVEVRSFGVRTPPATHEKPSYGIIGIFHVIPPALAWLWRLVAPRGYANPSIIDEGGMTSEGVGSYWPFATGKQVDQANLLLKQILQTPKTSYVLIPNQYIGAYKVGFAAEWLAREFLARHGGAVFYKEKMIESRCPLLGYTIDDMRIDGQSISQSLLRTETQDSLGLDGFDAGAKILIEFFQTQLEKFNTKALDPLGREIISCFNKHGSLEDFIQIIPMNFR